ncbi:MAG TPA: fluoride efflux transporter CrcB [Chloroflexia bacterium]|nr:fluoride efflux transporter CrcB [Chloroflexia bacterium]
MHKYLIVGGGGALGALVRYWLGGLFKIGTGGFPVGTFLINLSGSFILGLFLTLITERYLVRAEWRLFFATGFVGAYTTFSSFTNEALTLYRQDFWLVGLLYSAASLLGGMIFVWLGYEGARLIAFGSLARTSREAELQSWREEESLERAELSGNSSTGTLPAEERSELDRD